MRGMGRGIAVLCLSAAAACAASLSGTWKLDVAKSKWGAKEKPAGGEITVQDRGREIAVSGTMQHATEESGRFEYSGPVDGKPHPAGGGSITLTRVDPETLESVWKSQDGRYVETSRTTISNDGRRLTRAVDLKRPGGEVKWTEVWDKQ